MFAYWQTEDITALNNLVGATWSEDEDNIEISSFFSEKPKIEAEVTKQEPISETPNWKKNCDELSKEQELIEIFLK